MGECDGGAAAVIYLQDGIKSKCFHGKLEVAFNLVYDEEGYNKCNGSGSSGI